ncbi:hypothetical protein Taro_035057, partial [Colocasia esculenta]|nr:hypothetical protein [Colocasia esculenta]
TANPATHGSDQTAVDRFWPPARRHTHSLSLSKICVLSSPSSFFSFSSLVTFVRVSSLSGYRFKQDFPSRQMGGDGGGKRSGGTSKRRRRRDSSSDGTSVEDGSSRSASSSDSDDEARSSRRRRRSGHRRRSRRESESLETPFSSKRKKNEKRRREREDRKKERGRESHRRRTRIDGGGKKRADSERSSSDGSSGSDYDSPVKPEATLRRILRKFPEAAGDLRELLQVVDSGQAVDVRGISNRPLVKLLKSLFWSLKLKKNEDGVFLLPSGRLPTLDMVGSLLSSHIKHSEVSHSGSANKVQPASLNKESMRESEADVGPCEDPHVKSDSLPNRRRNADLEVDEDLFIGPPPPAVVAEAESANEAERFEEVARIIGVEPDKPYDVLGVNWKMSSENIKKKYWKLSLMVHPDKCSHPQAHEAFVILNKAFKLLQDPELRKATDEKIKLKEEQEAFKVELQALREAAKWRRSQGISMEGDDILLAETETEAKLPPQRDEWMTTLPPERKQGVTMQSTYFSKSGKEGRGDTSVWTDSPLDKAQKAKQSYLEAYSKATAIASADDEKKKASADADLIEKYNRTKRSKSLLEKHQEEGSRPKKKSRQPEKEDWVGQHPWKPWDREKDLSAGRQKVSLDPKNMGEGLASRFSSGSFQRDFL